MGLLGTTLIGATLFAKLLPDDSAPAQTDCAGAAGCAETVQYNIQRLPSPTASPTAPLAVVSRISATATSLPTPAPLTGSELPAAASPTVTATAVTSGAVSSAGDAIGPTPVLTATRVSSPTAPAATLTATVQLTATATPSPTATRQPDAVASAYVEPYTSTNQVAPPPACPTSSAAQFDLIPIEGAPSRDHPDAVHGDLNLALRGFIAADAPLEQVTYNGSTDSNAPRLHGLFEPNRQAQIIAVGQVNDWNWDPSQCGGHPRGCPAPPSEDIYWPVTMVGLATTPGETIHIPERGPEIYPGGYIAMVLYAEETRLTLGYTRRDTVSAGYTIHLENICVDPNLLVLYNSQMDAAGWNGTGHLPALRNNQAIGTAKDNQIGVAIRDVGTFMDPRSHKDWWK